ncbi:MAG: ferredoxin, partial [Candidatus Aenigmarchaeota archaeon]|nr:ferredoxin [Candidatus Aenigmarchaeota archaeon]
KDKCIGCGACEAICSDIFKMEDDKAVVTKEEVDDPKCAKEAADLCPVDAIIIE